MDYSRKLKAIELRKTGLSYSEIRKIVKVSKSTISIWLKDIELTDGQKRRLGKLQATGYLGAKTNQARSKAHHDRIKEAAKKELSRLIKDPLFVCGLMLYWAEGDKRSGRVQFTNSDSQMIKLMMKWFRDFCGVPEPKFRIGLFLHALHVRKDCLEFWSQATGLPVSQFNRPYIKPAIFSNRKNKLYEGACAIKIYNKDLISRILGWMEGAKEIFLIPRRS